MATQIALTSDWPHNVFNHYVHKKMDLSFGVFFFFGVKHETLQLKSDLLNPLQLEWESPGSVVDKVFYCSIKVIGFKLQLCNYIHFWTNAPWEKHESSYLY